MYGRPRRVGIHMDVINCISRPVAGVLMSYSRGCAAVLTQMSEGDTGDAGAATPRSPTDSASDGYHSDSDDPHPLPDRYVLTQTC